MKFCLIATQTNYETFSQWLSNLDENCPLNTRYAVGVCYDDEVENPGARKLIYLVHNKTSDTLSNPYIYANPIDIYNEMQEDIGSDIYNGDAIAFLNGSMFVYEMEEAEVYHLLDIAIPEPMVDVNNTVADF